MKRKQPLNLDTLEPYEDEYSKAKKKEISDNTRYYNPESKVTSKFDQWQLDAMNTPTVVPLGKAEKLVSSIDHDAQAPAKQSRSSTQKI
ncbi:hypothetical protein [Burkholderia contaminans]|uniref:hypothetical protein n=1 Tax=Burkholderia contaminans TaxID=488447 RepID=UPI00158EAB61|nr:hypothetical protein [Burkholderia contaminans]